MGGGGTRERLLLWGWEGTERDGAVGWIWMEKPLH